MSTWTIVVAAGSGRRFGTEVPKQYLPLGEGRVLDESLATAATATDGVVLVVAPDRAGHPEPGADRVVPGGASRADSVRAGLAAVPDDADVIVVHDGARPLASTSLYAAVVAAVRHGADAAVPGLAVTDTLKEVDGDRVVRTVDRAALVAVQTPQAFAARALRDAHRAGGDATDDAGLVEAAGGRVVVVPGEARNLKVTHPDDLPVASAWLHRADR